ncbi:hypothetical protein ACIPMW_15855 [Streptomyces sp. NPDC086669]|uniref:hypothetical protein n=1 Tax=Streptomyces sp. NPDC086669 TaxID=3365753 RepID=UPI003830DD9C
MEQGTEVRFLGQDPETGKSILVVPAPGGQLERIADIATLETASVLAALVGEILEDGTANEGELSAFVPALYEALCDVVRVTARLLDSD